ncbi:hypothetical protein NM688_g1943 [Phlebia brevispora]|uniref:Uncharacterized protein n=1 Tax=Phlebia brevispora TaxID=194682 RepID=A0ACC1TA02_9APHY|nr:hypothetical protein NM688_g1943 [Phlebia brevispora]
MAMTATANTANVALSRPNAMSALSEVKSISDDAGMQSGAQTVLQDVLALVPPTMLPLEDHEILVKVEAMLQDPSDWKYIDLVTQEPTHKTHGRDFSGIVVEVGKDARDVGVSVGDQVAGSSAMAHDSSELPVEMGGTHSPTKPPSSPILTAAQRPSSPSPRRARAPTMTQHNSRSIVLPTPEILSGVAGGAHYAGAFTTHDKHVHPAQVEKHKRSLSMNADDPLVEEKYHDVVHDLQELFCGRPTLAILERRWRRDAVLEDPWSKCVGFGEVAAHFFALSKICSQSERLATRIVSASLKPNRLIFSQTQAYTLRWIGSRKVISSFVVVELDDDLKIIRLVDQWNGEDPPARWYSLWWRILSAKIAPWFVHVPRHPASGSNAQV